MVQSKKATAKAKVKARAEQSIEADIVIIGAGLVGTALTQALAPTGLSIYLVEAGNIVSPPQKRRKDKRVPAPQVSALNLASIQFLNHLDAWPNIGADYICPYYKMQVWDANSDAQIEFDCEQTDYEKLGVIAENQAIVKALMDALSAHDNVKVHDKSPLKSLQRQGSHLQLTAGNMQLNTRLLIGADGQQSQVRTLAKLPTETGHFNQQAIVASIQTERPHQNTAYQCFHHTGPLAYLPLSSGESSIVWSCDDGYARHLLALSNTDFAQEISAAMQAKLGNVQLTSKPVAFGLKQIHAKDYVADNIALVGDAAHRTHPLAGLGANIGLLDAAALAQLIHEKHVAGRNIGLKSNLRPYERWRKGQNGAVLGLMQMFKTAFGSDSAPITKVRALLMNSAAQSSSAKRLFSQLAMGVDSGMLSDLPESCQVLPYN